MAFKKTSNHVLKYILGSKSPVQDRAICLYFNSPFPSDVTTGSAWRMHHGFVLKLAHNLKCLFLHQFTSRTPNASLMIE